MKAITEVYPLLATPAKIAVTTHQKPDPDAMGSSLALCHLLRQLGHTVTVVSPTNWADFLKWMPGAGEVIDFEANREKATMALKEAEWVFCLDYNHFDRTKNLAPLLRELNATKVLVDHHQQPDTAAFQYGISDTGKSSTCEMIYDFIVEGGWSDKITLDMASCLYSGVIGDTGSFRFKATKASVHRMVAHLKDLGLNHTEIHEALYDNFLENRLRFIGHVLSNRMEVFYEYNAALISITKGDLLRFNIKTGDTEGLVNYPLSIQGIKFAGLVIDRDEERKWSFRSKGDFDVNTFARLHFEGGGHFNAAGGRSSDALDVTAQKFRNVLKEFEHQLT
ncbi:bifunctional oligoribonuclease/PAP phosphatase NrnA [Parasegetibacter sp. NRK P23]|uniref:DHH family phosphoesterase n=1 Tax=Parasegetibacter sp. NRK P23 TaxID=2942999 RepID=UPI0020436664|nr:bifunctional oligoribonuclease/PAP phosphatase NrnA [Parasegetibacter sp. NRK P23]MCM5528266.1 bifunctional oligoribonuclease/PAP phosphatase NrnA [Parasegetibacter sp. NRK P23]